MQKDEGLFYRQSVIIDSNSQYSNGSFSFVLLGKKQQIVYSILADTVVLGRHPQRVWKLKVDDYQIAQLQLVDVQGRRWSWPGPYRNPLLVRASSLTNGGTWFLVQLKQKNQLSFLIKSTKNVFQTEKSQGSFGSIIDGQTGREELSLVQIPVTKQNEIRAVFSSKRVIGMYYKINLFRQNQYATAVMEVVQSNDLDLRSCYTDFLDRGSKGQGTLTYTMLMSHQNRSIRTLKVKQSDFRDDKFLECLNLKLRALSFPISESVIGELTLIFQMSES